MSDRQKVLKILNSAIAPMPVDQISNTIKGMGVPKVREVLNTLLVIGKVACRSCEDGGHYAEWWLIEKEGELIL